MVASGTEPGERKLSRVQSVKEGRFFKSLRTASLLVYGYRSVQETPEGGVVTNFPILTVCFFSFHSFFPFSFFASRYRLAPTNPLASDSRIPFRQFFLCFHFVPSRP